MFKTKYFELKNNCAHKQQVELQTLITKIDTFFNKKIKTNKELIKEFKKILEPKLEKFVVDAKMFKIQRYKIWKNGKTRIYINNICNKSIFFLIHFNTHLEKPMRYYNKKNKRFYCNLKDFKTNVLKHVSKVVIKIGKKPRIKIYIR